MRHPHLTVTSLVLGLLLPACTAAGPGSDSDASAALGGTWTAADPGLGPISCDIVDEADPSVTIHYCMEAVGLGPADRAAAVKQCAGLMGTLGTGCPPTTLGSCLDESQGYALTVSFYPDGVETEEEAQMVCTESGGAWTSSS